MSVCTVRVFYDPISQIFHPIHFNCTNLNEHRCWTAAKVTRWTPQHLFQFPQFLNNDNQTANQSHTAFGISNYRSIPDLYQDRVQVQYKVCTRDKIKRSLPWHPINPHSPLIKTGSKSESGNEVVMQAIRKRCQLPFINNHYADIVGNAVPEQSSTR